MRARAQKKNFIVEDRNAAYSGPWHCSRIGETADIGYFAARAAVFAVHFTTLQAQENNTDKTHATQAEKTQRKIIILLSWLQFSSWICLFNSCFSVLFMVAPRLFLLGGAGGLLLLP